MEQLFNLSMWIEFFRAISPAAFTRAIFAERNDTHKTNR